MAGDGLTRDQLEVVRSWVGTVVTDETLHDRYNRLRDVDGVILEELRYQIAELLSSPTSFSADGISIGTDGNVRELRQRLNDFINSGGTGLDDTPPRGAFAVAKIVRADPR